MKSQHVLRLVCAFWIAAVWPAAALTLYWDADGNPANNNIDGTGLGGAGTWTGSGLWWDGTSAANQTWSDGNNAVLSGTAGRIQLGTNVVAASLQVDAPGYTIDLCAANGGTTAYALTVNGISGTPKSCSVVCSSTTMTKPFTLGISSGSATFGGSVTGGRIEFIKDGAGTLNMTNKVDLGATYATFRVKGGGRLNLVGNTGSKDAPGYVFIEGNSIFDLGDNGFSARNWSLFNAGNTITSSGSGRLILSSTFSGSDLLGLLTGSLMVEVASNFGTANSNFIRGDNDYSGGTLFSFTGNGTLADLTVTSDTGLGTGRVRLENSNSANTSRLSFRSSTPSLGSLESAGVGAKSVVLGAAEISVASAALKATWTNNFSTLVLTAGSTKSLSIGQPIFAAAGLPAGAVVTAITDGAIFTISQNATASKTGTAIGTTAVNTTLSVGTLNQADDVFGGVISEVSGTVGSVTKVGTGTWTLSNTNIYTGTTRVENGTLSLVKNSGFAAGTLKYTSVKDSAVITITTGSASLLVPGQLVSGTGIPATARVSSISGNQVTLSVPATAAGTAQNLTAYAMDGSLISPNIDIVGGTLNGSGTISFPLASATDGVVMTSGSLDISKMNLSFVGVPAQKRYTLVDYSAGGDATFATSVNTANSFASATNIPEGYKIDHDTTDKLVTLQKIPLATMVIIL